MRIVQTAGAPNPRRVRIYLAEKGLTVPCDEVDLMAGDLKTDAFREINPTETVPVLVLDDGRAISETMAICRYFEETSPVPALFGTGAIERAEVEMWNRRMELGLFFRVAQVFRHLHPKMSHLEVPQVAAWGEANKPKVLEILAILDRQLSAFPFVAGRSYSVADITALVAIDFMKVARLERPVSLVNVTRWHDEVSRRPSAAA